MKDRNLGSKSCFGHVEDYVFGLVLALIVVFYFPLLHSEFFSVDDLKLSQIPQLLAPFSWASLKEIWRVGSHIDYYPLRDLSYLIDIKLFTNSPFIFRVHNLLLFLGTIILLRTLLIQMNVSRKWATAGLSLWGLQAYHIEMVSWISARKDLLALFFAVLSAVIFLCALRSGTKSSQWLSALCYLASLLSKASFVFLPLIGIAYFYLKRHQASPQLRRLLISLSAVAVFYSLFQVYFYTSVNDMRWSYPLSERILSSTAALGKILAGVMLPYINVLDVENWGQWYRLNQSFIPAGFLFLLLMALAARKTWKQRDLSFLAILAFFVFYLPVSGLIFSHRNFYSPRYLEGALVGLFIVLWLKIQTARHRWIFTALMLLASLFHLRSEINNWDSNLEIRRTAFERNPRSLSLTAQYFAEVSNELQSRDSENAMLKNELLKLRLRLQGGCGDAQSSDACLRWWMLRAERGEKDEATRLVKRLKKLGASAAATRAELNYSLRFKAEENASASEQLLSNNEWLTTPERRLLHWTSLCTVKGPELARSFLVEQYQRNLLREESLKVFLAEIQSAKRKSFEDCL